MPIPANHIIQRQTVWMDQPPQGSSKLPAFGLQERLSAYCRHTLPGVLESVFDGFADADMIIRLDTLDLDAGTISSVRFEEQLTQRIRQQAKQELTRLLNNPEPGDTRVERYSRAERLEQQFWFFLHHGHLPLWADNEAVTRFSNWLMSPSAGSFRSQLRAILPDNSLVARRLISHCSDAALMRVFSSSTDEEMTGKLAHLFQTIHQKFSYLSAPTIREQYWLSRFRTVNSADSREAYLTDFYESLYLLNVSANEKSDRLLFYVTLLQIVESGKTKMLLAERKVSIKTLQQLIDQAKNHKADTATKTDPNVGQPSQPDVVNEPFSGDQCTDNETTINEEITNQETQSPPLTGPGDNPPMYADSLERAVVNRTDAVAKSTIKPTNQKQSETPLPDAEIYVSMAGIVLLHPFLATLFTEMDLIRNRLWVSPEASEKGVQVLAWLATGTEFCPEYTMPLLKLLCGLPMETVVSPDIALTDLEKELTTEVLEAVLTHWTVLKNTSPAGLQESFLQREGKLTAVDGGWRLSVERKTIDILLDKLPWGVSMVKLPWMPDLLFVDWI